MQMIIVHITCISLCCLIIFSPFKLETSLVIRRVNTFLVAKTICFYDEGQRISTLSFEFSFNKKRHSYIYVCFQNEPPLKKIVPCRPVKFKTLEKHGEIRHHMSMFNKR